MSNTVANRRYVEQLEADSKKLKQEKTAAEAIATLSDERMKAAYAAKDEVLAEKAKVQEMLAITQVEKSALEDQSQRTERRLQEENSTLQASVRQGLERAKELQAQLEQSQNTKGQLDAQLAVSASERRGTDETQRRTEQLLARFQQDHPALVARCEAAEDHSRELRLTRDSMNEEMATLKRELAQLMAEKSGLAEISRKSEEETGKLEQTKSHLNERVESAEARGRELQHAKDAAFAERSRALQQLAVLTSEKNAADEHVMRLQTQSREERGSLTVRAETAEAACREVTRDRDSMAEEKARLNEQMAVMQVEKREMDARSTQLERTLQLVQEERGALQVRCESVEGRLRDMEALKESTVGERQKLEQETAVSSAERRRIEEACARTEAHVKELQKDKQSLQARCDAAEARVRDVLGMRDALAEERTRALETLATCQAEKSGGEELVRRLELQIRTTTDDKAAMAARADAAEERGKELTRQRDAAHAERSKLTEQLGVAHTERRAVEEVLRLTEVRIGEERPQMIQAREFAEKRVEEMEAQRDALAKERQALMEQLTCSKDAHSEASRELATGNAERRALEDLLHRTEARLGDERASLRAAADGAEARCAEASRQRDQAIEERIRAAEAQAASEADRRSAEDASLRLTAELKRMGEERTANLERIGGTDERCRELSLQLEKAQEGLAEMQQERQALQREKTSLAQNLAVTQTELRGKEVVSRHGETRLHEEKLALQARSEAAEERCHEASARRDALHADRARLQDAYNALLEERNRLEDNLTNMQTEKRGLEELALYVNAITRGGGGMGKSSGISVGGGAYGNSMCGDSYTPQGGPPSGSEPSGGLRASGGTGAPHGLAAMSTTLPTRTFGREPETRSPSTWRSQVSSTPPPAPAGPTSVSWGAEDIGAVSSGSMAAARELSAQRGTSTSTLELLDPRDAEFRRLDKNGDGVITAQEWAAARGVR